MHNLHKGKKKKKRKTTPYEAERFFLSVYFNLIAKGLELQKAKIRALPVPCCSEHRMGDGEAR